MTHPVLLLFAQLNGLSLIAYAPLPWECLALNSKHRLCHFTSSGKLFPFPPMPWLRKRWSMLIYLEDGKFTVTWQTVPGGLFYLLVPVQCWHVLVPQTDRESGFSFINKWGILFNIQTPPGEDLTALHHHWCLWWLVIYITIPKPSDFIIYDIIPKEIIHSFSLNSSLAAGI